MLTYRFTITICIPGHCSSIKTEEREGEVKFYTPQPGLIAAALSIITLKAIARGKGC